jgi:hypothetical protein
MNAFAPIEPMVEIGKVNAKLVFLARAATRFQLVEAGEMDIDTAFDDLVISLQCSCGREMVERWERNYPHRGEVPRRHRPLPQSTIDAVQYCVHERSLTALDEPKNVERLSHFNADAKAQLNKQIEKLILEKGIRQ